MSSVNYLPSEENLFIDSTSFGSRRPFKPKPRPFLSNRFLCVSGYKETSVRRLTTGNSSTSYGKIEIWYIQRSHFGKNIVSAQDISVLKCPDQDIAVLKFPDQDNSYSVIGGNRWTTCCEFFFKFFKILITLFR